MALLLLCAACAGLESNPFQTFYSPGYQNTIGPPLYLGPPLPPAPVDPPVEYAQVISLEQVKALGRHFAALGYKRIGMSMFESNWPTPHREAAAEMGRSLGADLVIYFMVGVGSRLGSVPHLTYEPGQSFSGMATSPYGWASVHGSSTGTFHTQYTTEEIGRYLHVAHYLTLR
jgi:hypothetical protein